MPSLKHLHIYERVKHKPEIYRCIHPECSHYDKKYLLTGKRAKCVCGNDYLLTARALKLKKPHCDSCGRLSDKVQKEIIAKVLKDEKEPEQLNLPETKMLPVDNMTPDNFYFADVDDTESELENDHLR